LVEPVKAAGELESFKTLAELEREYLEKVLVATEGNKSQTAKILGITVKTLYNKLHDCGLFAKYSRK
jgi:two-component system response regulator HydG